MDKTRFYNWSPPYVTHTVHVIQDGTELRLPAIGRVSSAGLCAEEAEEEEAAGRPH